MTSVRTAERHGHQVTVALPRSAISCRSAAAAGAAATLADVARPGGAHLRAAGEAERAVDRGAADELEELGGGVGGLGDRGVLDPRRVLDADGLLDDLGLDGVVGSGDQLGGGAGLLEGLVGAS